MAVFSESESDRYEREGQWPLFFADEMGNVIVRAEDTFNILLLNCILYQKKAFIYMLAATKTSTFAHLPANGSTITSSLNDFLS